jgi:hypothetical protein
MGDGLSPRGVSLRRPRPEPRRRQRRHHLGRAQERPPQEAYERGSVRRGGTGARRWDDRGCSGGHAGGSHNVHRAPEEEETGILHPEVGDHCPTRRVFEISEGLTFLFSRSQGGAHRAPPRTCQGAEVGRGRPY